MRLPHTNTELPNDGASKRLPTISSPMSTAPATNTSSFRAGPAGTVAIELDAAGRAARVAVGPPSSMGVRALDFCFAAIRYGRNRRAISFMCSVPPNLGSSAAARFKQLRQLEAPRIRRRDHHRPLHGAATGIHTLAEMPT